MTPSALSLSIASDNWKSVIELCRSDPRQARQWSVRHGLFEGLKDSRVLALHEALVSAAPLDVIQALLEAHPDAVYSKESSYQRLPLHCACRRNADPNVIHLLLSRYADAAILPDSLGRLPLHYALSNGADPALVKLLLIHRPNCARGVDHEGWTPLHVAASVGAPLAVVEVLLDAYPEAVWWHTNKGSSVVRCLHKYVCHRDDIKSMVINTRRRQDYLRVGRQPSLPRIEDAVLV